ncbi:hypothetical protein C8Q75DRAFT_809119 [Abortiporus biennis]|nr:hypothetical protein C8Q75DRAFT_809119 [Abortiporus biennis]
MSAQTSIALLFQLVKLEDCGEFALVAFALRYEHDSDFYNFVLNSPKLFTTFSIFTPYFYQFQDSKHIMRSNILFVVFAIFSATLPAFCVPVVFDSGSFAVARSNIPKYRKRALGNRLFGRSDEIPSTTVESTPPLPNDYVKRAEHIKGLINSIATEMELSERELRELSQMSRGINPESYEGGNTLAKRDADVTVLFFGLVGYLFELADRAAAAIDQKREAECKAETWKNIDGLVEPWYCKIYNRNGVMTPILPIVNNGPDAAHHRQGPFIN